MGWKKFDCAFLFFLFFSRDDYDLLEDYAIWPILIVTFEIFEQRQKFEMTSDTLAF